MISSKAMIKFRSKFHLQIPLHFYRTVAKLKFVIVMVKSFDKDHHFPKDHHFSNFHILVTILFFMIKIQAY